MRRPGGKIAIIGGGMAALSAAWRLSEPGSRDRFESITVYQRGWRLGGKAASSRGANGRIEEHGLHIWLGSYENAFSLLRECYAELDRATTDPTAPIQTWEEAIAPADNPGLADSWNGNWVTWHGTHPRDDKLPGDPDSTGRELTAAGFVERALRLVLAFAGSLREAAPGRLTLSVSPDPPAPTPAPPFQAVLRATLAALLAVVDPQFTEAPASDVIEHALDAVRNAIDADDRVDRRRSWVLISLVVAAVRGIIADKLITDAHGFAAIDDEDFCDWILRHGAHPDVVDSAMVRGVYDLVFGYRDGDPRQPAVGAGVMTFLIGQVLFGYRGAIFWKMTAGMGDVVIAPLYQALRRRGVEFEFFHRLDALHLDASRQSVATITMGRQARLAEGIQHYEPLTRIRGLPVFPKQPIAEQLRTTAGLDATESHFGAHDDVEIRTLKRGVDFDHVVLAVSIGMIPIVAGELIEDRPEWRDMTTHVRTVATQAFQIWLRPDEASLGWNQPGATVSAYLPPFDTWASMPQTLWAEDWPRAERPGTVAYFCGSLDAPWPTTDEHSRYASRYADQVGTAAVRFLDHHAGLYYPNAVTEQGFAWHLLCGVNGRRGREALSTQHVSVNIDPSDRYVQSVPGTERYRLRPDESGYDNLVLAGDWTDSGMNAGCIEAAVMSGLEAANALMGRHRYHRIRGLYLP
ncbi:MAG TPA: FAD-dependent oxidoreductase [Xanthobacteraceae bacterium]|nr:FAD-dependent oxidoreductase [Xanthobacteraceae bacterium]